MRISRHILILFLLSCAPPLAAQTVLFDGLTAGERNTEALLVPGVVTGDSYGLFAKLDYGILERVNLFGTVGGTLNGGAHANGGLGWSANFFQQSDAMPVNFGFFNSYTFQSGSGADALVTLAPIFSHSFDRDLGGRVTPYAGLSATLLVNAPGKIINGVVGVKITDISDRWDLITELQPGERTQFAAGLIFRF